ncbi:uncharacterized protein AMSG_02236 [Thecamonas trahens ATCC 50062]|uniref:Uncharacterized protein n=1 Tax=Thecamonas trahens ATCC 50062 TaxID=461836 RepID=A0A0L0DVR0_THETB|nr:hypothetical protein AMSG_02236 [Thecamonas trahens ATCC 50062]KNC56267.1 hypothetical protein AMSG_02236 [Thecamonas trahens ATCC 50062]|eukprot:XP_013760786.1 hypothetical protein AMSG_02236 [Thecamonas trahens ATCC 50062]
MVGGRECKAQLDLLWLDDADPAGFHARLLITADAVIVPTPTASLYALAKPDGKPLSGFWPLNMADSALRFDSPPLPLPKGDFAIFTTSGEALIISAQGSLRRGSALALPPLAVDRHHLPLLNAPPGGAEVHVVLASSSPVAPARQPVSDLAAWASSPHAMAFIDADYGPPRATADAELAVDLHSPAYAKYAAAHRLPPQSLPRPGARRARPRAPPDSASHAWRLLDPHVLAPPLAVPLSDVVAVAVSYFAEPSERRYAAFFADDLPPMAVAAVALVSFATDEILDVVPVEASYYEPDSQYTARIYAPMVVGDVDGDGSNDIIVATSMGAIYVLDLATRKLHAPYPVFFDSVHVAPVLVPSPVAGSPGLALLIADTNSNVVLFSGATASSLWHARVAGNPSPLVVADADNDGELDVVLGSTSGHLWAFSLAAGESRPHFPLRVGGRITAAPTPLAPGVVAVPARDGYVYVVEASASSGHTCVEKIDIGETLPHALQAADADASGVVTLFGASLSGRILALETNVETRAAALASALGIVFTEANPAAAAGWSVRLHLYIHDAFAVAPAENGYTVVVTLGHSDNVIHTATVSTPGAVKLDMPLSAITTRGPVTLVARVQARGMTSGAAELGLVAHDAFYRVLKVFVLVPMAFAVAAAWLASYAPSRSQRAGLLGKHA